MFLIFFFSLTAFFIFNLFFLSWIFFTSLVVSFPEKFFLFTSLESSSFFDVHLLLLPSCCSPWRWSSWREAFFFPSKLLFFPSEFLSFSWLRVFLTRMDLPWKSWSFFSRAKTRESRELKEMNPNPFPAPVSEWRTSLTPEIDPQSAKNSWTSFSCTSIGRFPKKTVTWSSNLVFPTLWTVIKLFPILLMFLFWERETLIRVIRLTVWKKSSYSFKAFSMESLDRKTT